MKKIKKKVNKNNKKKKAITMAYCSVSATWNFDIG